MSQETKNIAVKSMFETGTVRRMDDIFKIIPKTNIYKKLGVGYITLLNKLKDPGLFTINELKILATIIDVDYTKIHDLAKQEADLVQQKTRKKSDKK